MTECPICGSAVSGIHPGATSFKCGSTYRSADGTRYMLPAPACRIIADQLAIISHLEAQLDDLRRVSPELGIAVELRADEARVRAMQAHMELDDLQSIVDRLPGGRMI